MSQTVFKCAGRFFRSGHQCLQRCVLPSSRISVNITRYCSSVLAPPTPEGSHKTYAPKLHDIVESISQLTLLEVSDLNELLKNTLKISDAPVMSMGVAPASQAAMVPAEEEAESSAKFVQTEFTVNLVKFDESKKVALIKAIKSVMTGMNLVQAKKFVESAPQPLKENVSKEEAQKLKETLEQNGAAIEIE